MEYRKTNILKLTLLGTEDFGPATIFFEKFELGKYFVEIECFGNAWSAFLESIESFSLLGIESIADYFWDKLQDKFEFDNGKFVEIVRGNIISDRRKKTISKDFARDMYDRQDWTYNIPTKSNNVWHCPLFSYENDFEDFVSRKLSTVRIPLKRKLSYQYLLEIIGNIKKILININKLSA